MIKPDGIEQSIWKAADDLIEALETEFADFSRDGQLRGAYMDRQYQVIQNIIAQAISLALKQDRELMMDSTHEYMDGQYGIGALRNPIDRGRILEIRGRYS